MGYTSLENLLRISQVLRISENTNFVQTDAAYSYIHPQLVLTGGGGGLQRLANLMVSPNLEGYNMR